MKNVSALDTAERILRDALKTIQLAREVLAALHVEERQQPTKRRKLSAAARKRIGDAQRKRWKILRGGKKAA
jgi:hypothetical protein